MAKALEATPISRKLEIAQNATTCWKQKSARNTSCKKVAEQLVVSPRRVFGPFQGKCFVYTKDCNQISQYLHIRYLSSYTSVDLHSLFEVPCTFIRPSSTFFHLHTPTVTFINLHKKSYTFIRLTQFFYTDLPVTCMPPQSTEDSIHTRGYCLG